MDENRRIIEINGVKMEVDMRNARVVTELKVGAKVKLLVPKYGDDVAVYPGVIVGFVEFQKLPTIVVAYIESGYNAELKFFYFNSASKGEIVAASEDYHTIEKAEVVRNMDRAIQVKEAEVADLRGRKDYFLRHFNAYFKPENVEA